MHKNEIDNSSIEYSTEKILQPELANSAGVCIKIENSYKLKNMLHI